jgi:hypothetical protein
MFLKWLRLIAAFAALGAVVTPFAAAQTQPARPVALDGGAVALKGPWQFHLGDDHAWASPGLDDTAGHDGWEQIDADRPWGVQGHQGYTGFAWYRRRVCLASADAGPNTGTAARPRDFALLIAVFDGSYEVFWDGRLMGHHGQMPPDAVWYYEVDTADVIPLGDANCGELAIRVWRSPLESDESFSHGGFTRAPKIGTTEAIQALRDQLSYQWLLSSQFSFAQTSLYSIVLLLFLAAWVRNRRELLPLWMALFCLGSVSLPFFAQFHLSFPRNWRMAEFCAGSAILNVSLWLLLLWLLDLRRNPRIVGLTKIVIGIDIACYLLDAITMDGKWWISPTTGPFFWFADMGLTVAYSVLTAFPVVLVVAAAREKIDPTRWIVALFAALAELTIEVPNALFQGNRFTHLPELNWAYTPLFSVLGSGISPENITSTLLLLALVFAGYRYLRANARRQSTLQQEMRNARAVQQVLIPEAIPEIPGFRIQAVYHPAGEVGGDFFQVMATPTGGALAVVGDVSGKGMPAAMTVSLLVGTFRTLAHYTQSPGEILAAMNQRMLGRSGGGFTTCLVLRVDPDGAVTLANAGHIPPYMDGREQNLDYGLPLGLVKDAFYNESTLVLRSGHQLTLVTDGVPEATDPTTGELFGFERTLKISSESAEKIAAAAQHFGQEDDITVLTLTFSPTPDLVEAIHA